MSADDNGAADVQKNLEALFKRKKSKALALCRKYATRAQEEFLRRQGTEQLDEGEFWTNRTSQAAKLVTGFTDSGADYVSFGLAHRMEYGVYLELANNRKHEALHPIIAGLASDFKEEVKKI
jgi:hypothetical protein